MVRMFLRGGALTLEIPVLPDVLAVDSDGDNDRETVLGLGEINILRDRKLRKISWSALFPAHAAPYVTGLALSPPIEYIKTLEAWRDARQPVRLLITGTDLNINVAMGIEKLKYEERGGEPGDLYYELDLTEYKDYSPRRITISADGKAVAVSPARAGNSPDYPTPSSYMVAPGDTLWMVAQRFYGDGSRYEALYTANKKQMDARNAATGGTRYTVYTGQVLIIP